MKKIISLTICALMPIFIYSQNIELNSLVGEWKWIDNTTSEELHVFLRPGTYEVPSIFGGGTENCLVGVYKYCRGGIVIVDYYSELSESKSSILYPISVLNTLSLSVRDYYLKNANGRNKILSGNSRIEYISNKQLRWILVDNAHESLSFSANSTYPSGISLPADIILTKVESLNPHRLKFHIVPDMFERDDYTIDQNGNPQVITDPELLNGFSIPENMILEKIK